MILINGSKYVKVKITSYIIVKRYKMTTKRTFLDPIGAGCRFVLLKSFHPNTKIRINDHTVQLVPDTIMEKMFYRPWVYGDSREDISALYPVIVRFIELYLNEKKKPPTSIVQSTQPIQPTVQSIPQTKKEKRHRSKSKPQQEVDLFGMGGTDDFDSNNVGFGGFGGGFGEEYGDTYESDCESEDNPVQINNTIYNVAQPHLHFTSAPVQQHPISTTSKGEHSDECYEALKTIAKYMIDGMAELQKTYEFGNAVMALQYYIDLLNSGIDGTYSQEKLPKHLKDFTSKNFLDNDKIKGLWTDKEIIHLAKLITHCFEPDQTETGISSYRAAIEHTLNKRDMIFKQMISSTNNS